MYRYRVKLHCVWWCLLTQRDHFKPQDFLPCSLSPYYFLFTASLTFVFRPSCSLFQALKKVGLWSRPVCPVAPSVMWLTACQKSHQWYQNLGRGCWISSLWSEHAASGRETRDRGSLSVCLSINLYCFSGLFGIQYSHLLGTPSINYRISQSLWYISQIRIEILKTTCSTSTSSSHLCTS